MISDVHNLLCMNYTPDYSNYSLPTDEKSGLIKFYPLNI